MASASLVAHYVHRDTLRYLPLVLQRRADAALRAAAPPADACNVLRFDADGRTALLVYENFDDDPFPSLVQAWLVGSDGRVGHRCFRENPPILHRKELLLAPNDPRRARFARLTAELEARVLFKDGHRIGRRRAWEERLAQAGLRVEDHRLVEVDPEG